MPFRQIDNPKFAFGYNPNSPSAEAGDPAVVALYRNMSSTEVISAGQAVIFSTLSTDGLGVTITTIAGSPMFAGVALGSGTTDSPPTLTSQAAPGAWVRVQTRGVLSGALLTSGTVAGDFVGTVNSTVAGSTGGGYLGTIASTQVAGAFYGVAGIAFSSGTTGTTPPFTATGPRGTVRLVPCVIPGSTL
jgi:hypothetical protein